MLDHLVLFACLALIAVCVVIGIALVLVIMTKLDEAKNEETNHLVAGLRQLLTGYEQQLNGDTGEGSLRIALDDANRKVAALERGWRDERAELQETQAELAALTLELVEANARVAVDDFTGWLRHQPAGVADIASIVAAFPNDALAVVEQARQIDAVRPIRSGTDTIGWGVATSLTEREYRQPQGVTS
jgi:hypothetical protein